MKATFNLFLFSFYIAGCSTTYQLHTDDMSPEQLNEELTNHKAQIVLLNGQKITATKIQVTGDTTLWVNPENDCLYVSSNHQINKIVVRDREKGALDGTFFGVLSGSVLASWQSGVYERKDDKSALYRPETVFLISVVMNTVIGVIIGHRNNYLFNEPEIIKEKKEVIVEQEEVVEVEVPDAEIREGFVIIHWQGKMIRLSASEVKQMTKRKERIVLTIPVSIYQEKFGQ
jgi:hypothetical protein